LVPRCDESLQQSECHVPSIYVAVSITFLTSWSFYMCFCGIGLPCTTEGLLFHSRGCYHIQGSTSGMFGSGCTAKKYLLTELTCVVLCCVVCSGHCVISVLHPLGSKVSHTFRCIQLLNARVTHPMLNCWPTPT